MAGILFENFYIYVDVVEAYGELKLLQKAKSMVENLRQRCPSMDWKVWNKRFIGGKSQERKGKGSNRIVVNATT